MVVSGGCFPTKRDTGSRSGHEETQATTQGGSGSEASRLPEEEEPASDEESQERSDTDWADFLSTHEVLTSAAFLGIERRMAGEVVTVADCLGIERGVDGEVVTSARHLGIESRFGW